MKKTSLKILFILAVLFALPFPTVRRGMQENEISFDDGDLVCGILPGPGDFMSDGFRVGYDYEILKRFAESRHVHADISLCPELRDGMEALLADSLDILAVRVKGKPDSLAEGLSAIAIDSTVCWLVKENPDRELLIGKWIGFFASSPERDSLLTRFFHGYNPYRKRGARDKSVISPYDDLLKKYAPVSGWDWKLLAAVVWQESKFRIQAVSPRGARGLMQFMPRTARKYGIRNSLDPEENIHAGARHLARLQRLFRDYAADEQELVKYALAAYNAGEGRFLGCIMAAQGHGFGSDTWDKLSLFLKTVSPDSIPLPVAVGDTTFVEDEEEEAPAPYLGAETVAYVGCILARYDLFRGVAPVDTVAKDSLLAVIAAADSLLGTDGAGGIDLGDEQAGDEQEQEDDPVSEEVGEEDPGEGDVDRHE